MVDDENIITELRKLIITRLDVILANAKMLNDRLRTDSSQKIKITYVMGEEIFTREEIEVGLAYLRLQGKLRALGL